MMSDLWWFYCGPHHNPNSNMSTAGHVSSSGCSVNGPSINNDNKTIFKAQNVSLETILSTYTCMHACVCAHTHKHTQRHPHTEAFWLYKAKYTQLKMGSKCPGDLEWIKTHIHVCVYIIISIWRAWGVCLDWSVLTQLVPFFKFYIASVHFCFIFFFDLVLIN